MATLQAIKSIPDEGIQIIIPAPQLHLFVIIIFFFSSSGCANTCDLQ